MAKKEKDPELSQQQPEPEIPAQEAAPDDQAPSRPDEQETLRAALAEQEDKYLRLAAEYDNFRKRTLKEKSSVWADAQAEAVLSFLPVYDNLERALKQETADQAYAKGVEMIMTQFKSVLEKLGVEEIPALGEPFDPAVHNAILHMEDESLGKNIVTEVFQAGFKLDGKVIRVAMVKVAN